MRNSQLAIRKNFLLLLYLLYPACSPKLISNVSGDFIPVGQNVEEDSSLTTFISPYKIKLEEEMNTVIGQSLFGINKTGIGETPIGNLIADFQLEFAEEFLGYSIDISIMNNGGIRNIFPEGDITLGNVYEVSPFDNYLQILELEAEDVINLVEYAIKVKNLGISGLTFESNEGKIKSILVNGKRLDEKQIYLLAANDYIANGGDNMSFLVNLSRKEESVFVLRDILIDRIKKQTSMGKTIEAKIEGRQIIK
jgi:2',3'-cyclic-nucleotide 2'-phosphodiesterase (5'-nucleotidase family)